ncbi:MAG TPA: hypothetical protein VFI28_12905 [Candidatus Limnocylindrales bacterium]|nr:hypothetical protein [Candidatus Limnocylindrales bacterium]
MAPRRLDWLRSTLARRSSLLLLVWFAILGPGYLALLGLDAIGVDARIYYRGSAAWLAGANPWDAVASYSVSYGTNYYHFAGLPTSVVLFAPATLLPESLFVAAWVLLSAASAVFVVRRVGLPIWWLLFPPLLEGVWSGNPGVVLMALLVAGNPVLGAVGSVLKIYALVPLALLGRARAVALSIGLVFATAIVAPSLWVSYVHQFGQLSGRLLSESDGGYSLMRYPFLVPVGAALLALLAYYDRRTVAWLAVPALWPSSELHYSILALPVASPLLAALIAIPERGILPFAVIAFMSLRLIRITWDRAGRRLPVELHALDRPIVAGSLRDASADAGAGA